MRFGKNTQRPKRRRTGLIIALCAVCAVGLFTGWMHVGARTLRVRYAEVTMADLPASFDGTKVLFVTDLDLCGVNDAASADRLFNELQLLKPDLLLLGGDYVSASLTERLNGVDPAMKTAARREFFEAISDFDAPLGKLAVRGENDGDRVALEAVASLGGVKLIDGGAEIISNGTDAIAVVGVDGIDVLNTAARFRKEQCVLALMHSPGHVIDARIAEASDGGSWCDLILAGHTHGGQVSLFGRSALNLTDTEQRFLSGWHTDGLAPLRVGQGVGCEGVNLRLGSQAEVWLITLRANML